MFILRLPNIWGRVWAFEAEVWDLTTRVQESFWGSHCAEREKESERDRDTYIHIHIYIYICMYMYTYIYMYVYIYIYVCVCVRIQLYTCRPGCLFLVSVVYPKTSMNATAYRQYI